MTQNEYQQEVLRTETRPDEEVESILSRIWNIRHAKADETDFELFTDIVSLIRRMMADRQLMLHALGLTGEAGEVADIIKKHIGHGHPLDLHKLKLELGDNRWYNSAIAHNVQLTDEEITQANVEKLRRRYPDGFDKERSINRTE